MPSTTHHVRETVSNRRVDCVLGNVALDARIVVAVRRVLGQSASLLLHFGGSLPIARAHLNSGVFLWVCV